MLVYQRVPNMSAACPVLIPLRCGAAMVHVELKGKLCKTARMKYEKYPYPISL